MDSEKLLMTILDNQIKNELVEELLRSSFGIELSEEIMNSIIKDCERTLENKINREFLRKSDKEIHSIDETP